MDHLWIDKWSRLPINHLSFYCNVYCEVSSNIKERSLADPIKLVFLHFRIFAVKLVFLFYMEKTKIINVVINWPSLTSKTEKLFFSKDPIRSASKSFFHLGQVSKVKIQWFVYNFTFLNPSFSVVNVVSSSRSFPSTSVVVSES